MSCSLGEPTFYLPLSCPLNNSLLISSQAKKFVESVPQVIRTEVPREEAEKLKTQLEAAGATVMLV